MQQLPWKLHAGAEGRKHGRRVHSGFAEWLVSSYDTNLGASETWPKAAVAPCLEHVASTCAMQAITLDGALDAVPFANQSSTAPAATPGPVSGSGEGNGAWAGIFAEEPKTIADLEAKYTIAATFALNSSNSLVFKIVEGLKILEKHTDIYIYII